MDDSGDDEEEEGDAAAAEEEYMNEQKDKLEKEKAAIMSDSTLIAEVSSFNFA